MSPYNSAVTRFKANILLTLTALIWGSAFVAQKVGMESIGPFTFVAARFILSFVAILPLVFRERRQKPGSFFAACSALPVWYLPALAGSFVMGVCLQQVGLVTVTATNAGFLTGLYVIFTPLFFWLILKRRPETIIALAAPFSLLGLWLLGGRSFSALTSGDLMIVGAAILFGLNTVLVGLIVVHTKRPFAISLLQYGVCLSGAGLAALLFENISLTGLQAALPALLYAGLISGAVAYTLQIVSQQYAPPSDAAVILSSEALFAALGGVLLLGDVLSLEGWLGCAVIFMAVLSIEVWPFFSKRRWTGRKPSS